MLNNILFLTPDELREGSKNRPLADLSLDDFKGQPGRMHGWFSSNIIIYLTPDNAGFVVLKCRWCNYERGFQFINDLPKFFGGIAALRGGYVAAEFNVPVAYPTEHLDTLKAWAMGWGTRNGTMTRMGWVKVTDILPLAEFRRLRFEDVEGSVVWAEGMVKHFQEELDAFCAIMCFHKG